MALAASACSASDSHPPETEVVGIQQQAIWGGNVDSTPALAANVVVRVTPVGSGEVCSGTLITPRVVLTAAHCVIDNSGAPVTAQVGVGFDREDSQFLVVDAQGPGIPFRNFPTTSPGYDVPVNYGRDVAVIFLSEPVLDRAVIQRPRVITPDPSAFHVGLAGWSSRNQDGSPNATAARFRTVAFFDPGELDVSRVDGRTDEFYWELDDDTAGAHKGDSGGPFFIRDLTTNARSLIGVISGGELVEGTEEATGVGHVADITGPAVASWLHTTLLDKNVNGGHPSAWYIAHGMDENSMWFGETDYTGPCNVAIDADCDHWIDAHDKCPARYNPTQGGPDDEADPDEDGVCSGSSSNSDNCPLAFNPLQENCNEDAERASLARGNNVFIMGDACDPVPCPRATPIGPPASQNCVSSPHLNRLLRDELDVRPVAPHSPIGTSAFLPDVPTKARYCQAVDTSTASVRCDRPDQMMDIQLFETETAASRVEPRTDRPWQRVTTAVTRSQLLLASRESNDGHFVTYADASAQSIFWDYRGDDAFWRTRGNLVGSARSGDADCTKSVFGAGTCLEGTFWLHAATPVGDTVSTVGTITVGTHGADLANSYVSISPDAPYVVPHCELPPIDPCVFSPLGCEADFLYRFEDGFCPMCTRPHLKAIADDRIQLPLLREPNQRMHGVLWKDVLDTDEELSLVETSTLARDILLTQHVVTAVETAAPHAGEIDAVALATDFGWESFYFQVGSIPDGDAFEVEPFLQGGGLLMSSMGGASRPSTSSSSASSAQAFGRSGAHVVYSRTMGGSFVVGGRDALGSSMFDVEYVPLYGDPYPLNGTLFGDVLAATLTRPSTLSDYASGNALPSFLWTVERDPELGEVHIVVREITRDEIGAPVFWLPIEDGGEDAYALATAWDAEDTALLTSSDRTTGAWGLAELGGFLPCVTDLGFYDESCFTIRTHYIRGDLGIAGHPFRGIYAEHDALVIPTARFDDAFGTWVPRTDRAPKPALGVAPTIASIDLRSWWAQ